MRTKSKREVDRAFSDVIEAMRKRRLVLSMISSRAMVKAVATLMAYRRKRKEGKHVP